MFLPLDNESTKNEVCRGEYNLTVDNGPRLRLPKEIVKSLIEHKVKILWVYYDPSGPRLIFCPDKFRDTYLKIAEACFPENMDIQEAYRTYICTGKPWVIKNHGKISVGTFKLNEKKLERGNQVNLLGIGQWYELSKNGN